MLLGASERPSAGHPRRVYTPLLLPRQNAHENSLFRSEQITGIIRLYDGRGDGNPLETVEKLHRFPVHLMTVRSPVRPCDRRMTHPDSTATDSTPSSRRTKVALLNIGGRVSSSRCRPTCPGCGRSRARQTCTSSRRYVSSRPHRSFAF